MPDELSPVIDSLEPDSDEPDDPDGELDGWLDSVSGDERGEESESVAVEDGAELDSLDDELLMLVPVNVGTLEIEGGGGGYSSGLGNSHRKS